MELFRTLGALIEPPAPGLLSAATALGLGPLPDAADHADLFLFELYPYASVYVGAEGMLGGEARDRVAGFWRALRLEPPAEPDHLTVMLALYAELADLEAKAETSERARCRRAREAWLWEHLLSWLFPYLAKLAEVAPDFYRRWGSLLEEALAEEAGRLDRDGPLPLHLREAPELADPRQGDPAVFLESLLAPARSGIVLTRSDLGRAASELGLGLRRGERRFVLKTFLGQEPEAVLGWLAAESRAWGERHESRRQLLGAIADFWAARAWATAALVDELVR